MFAIVCGIHKERTAKHRDWNETKQMRQREADNIRQTFWFWAPQTTSVPIIKPEHTWASEGRKVPSSIETVGGTLPMGPSDFLL